METNSVHSAPLEEPAGEPMLLPEQLKSVLPLTGAAARTVACAREAIEGVLRRSNRRLLAVVGPCSIHDREAALEYALRLKELAARLSDVLVLVMRVYFEKPRTTVGWKGFLNDPFLDGSCRIRKGHLLARQLLLDINSMGLPAATEILEPTTFHYLGDLISWVAIGARTTESQVHRQLASGMGCPVGFKNATDGRVEVAVDAIKAAAASHSFIALGPSGQCLVTKTSGNPFCHVVLRGGAKPNYDAKSTAAAADLLRRADLPANLLVDCSHANSRKNAANQPHVLEACIQQLWEGNSSIIGFMLESNLHWGNQSLCAKNLRYGVSITDECIDWQSTETCLVRLADQLASRQ